MTIVRSVEPNGVIHGDWDMHDPACVIPDHPALPAVARWLADGQETVAELRASFQEIRDVAESDLLFRNADLVTLLDDLLAALTEAGE